MPANEYRQRMAKCFKVYNTFLESGNFEQELTRSIRSTVDRVRSICTTRSGDQGAR
jgi:hypothetical protein